MKYEIEKLPKKTYKLKITIEAEKVKETHNHVISETAKATEVPGFRKGSAPINLVEPQLDKAKIRGEVVNHLVPPAYDQAIKESLIKPILLPKIEIVKFEEGKDLVFEATTCEAPEIILGSYRDEIAKLKTQNSKQILGADGQPAGEPHAKSGTDPEQERISKVLDCLLESSTVEISDLLIEEEVNHMLGRLVDQTGRLGITVDQYLASISKDVQTLKNEYKSGAEKSLMLEFLLVEVAKNENLKVDENEVSATINVAPDEESRKSLSDPANQTYLRSVLLKNKTAQKLLEYLK